MFEFDVERRRKRRRTESTVSLYLRQTTVLVDNLFCELEERQSEKKRKRNEEKLHRECATRQTNYLLCAFLLISSTRYAFELTLKNEESSISHMNKCRSDHCFRFNWDIKVKLQSKSKSIKQRWSQVVLIRFCFWLVNWREEKEEVS